jgi:hypothetical protein
MIRTQIQLTESQARRLRAVAREQRISLAEAIRRCIDDASAVAPAPSRAARYARAASLIGAFSSRTKSLSTDHDKHLEDAFS